MQIKNLLAALVCTVQFGHALALPIVSEISIATINANKILTDSKLAKEAVLKFQVDFSLRERELRILESTLKQKSTEIEQAELILSAEQLKEKQSEIEALGRELRRKKQQFFEDRDSRKRDDIQYIFGIANQVVKKIAERAKINMVFQDVVYANPRIDITVKVIEVMDSMPTNK